MIPLWAIKASMIALLFALIAGGYFWWKNQVASAALDSCNAEWAERDDATHLQSILIQTEADTRVKIETERIENAYKDAISVYADYAERLRVTPKAATASRIKNRVPTETSCTKDSTRSSEETLSIKAVELIIEKICLPHMEVK